MCVVVPVLQGAELLCRPPHSGTRVRRLLLLLLLADHLAGETFGQIQPCAYTTIGRMGLGCIRAARGENYS